MRLLPYISISLCLSLSSFSTEQIQITPGLSARAALSGAWLQREGAYPDWVLTKCDTVLPLAGFFYLLNELNTLGIPSSPAIKNVKLYPNKRGTYLLILARDPSGKIHSFPCQAREFQNTNQERRPFSLERGVNWALMDAFPMKRQAGTWTFEMRCKVGWTINGAARKREIRLPLGEIVFVDDLLQGKKLYWAMCSMFVSQIQSGRDPSVVEREFRAAIAGVDEDSWFSREAFDLLFLTAQYETGYEITHRRLDAVKKDDSRGYKLFLYYEHDRFCKALRIPNKFAPLGRQWSAER